MSLSIIAEWERLEKGAPEERACFAALGVRFGNIWMTEADDVFVNRVRERVYLPAYRLAEWLAWNWWRLRWEPERRTSDWAMSHRLSTIGGGFVWPNVTISSDGERVVVLAKPTGPKPEESLRYIADYAGIVSASELESSIDLFVDLVRGQLRAEKVDDTNLDQIWLGVLSDRTDPGVNSYRKFEAILGFDPGEAPESQVDALLRDSASLGVSAMNELAASRSATDFVPGAEELRSIARSSGFDTNPRDAVRLSSPGCLPPVGEVEAWKRGVAAAQALRAQEGLAAEPISDSRLVEMAGVSAEALQALVPANDFSYALDHSPTAGRIVLRSNWAVNRRFALTRILGDRVISGDNEPLFLAAETSTYRQKMQRAFAAEFLAPFEAVEDMLGIECRQRSIEEVAEHFKVSDRAIGTMLVNHGRLSRDEFLDGMMVA